MLTKCCAMILIKVATMHKILCIVALNGKINLFCLFKEWKKLW